MSSVGVVEVAFWTATDAYKQDPAGTIKRTVEIVRGAPGIAGSVYHGLAVERPDEAVLVAPWTSLEAHQALMKSDRCAELLENFGKAIAGQLKLVHVKATSDPSAALDAPVVELVRVTLQPGKTPADATALLQELAGSKAPGVTGIAWGFTVEDEREGVFFVGWQSIEAHHDWQKKSQTPETEAFVVKMTETLKIDSVHVKLGKY